MAKELTPLGKFGVWILLPALAGAVGYRYIGPNIGGIGARLPAVRSLGQELAKKVGKGAAQPAKTTRPGAKPLVAPPPASDGATEFQRIREESNKEQARPRRTQIDRVD